LLTGPSEQYKENAMKTKTQTKTTKLSSGDLKKPRGAGQIKTSVKAGEKFSPWIV
jgi:hypothetical protein